MSFVDELRNAPKNKEKELLIKYTDLFYDRIKSYCKFCAEEGDSSARYSLSYFYDEYIEDRAEYEDIEEKIGKYMTQTHADEMKALLSEKLRRDGFVSFEIEYDKKQQYRSEVVYVERSEREKTMFRVSNFLTGANQDVEGSYKTKRVPAGYRYCLEVKVKW